MDRNVDQTLQGFIRRDQAVTHFGFDQKTLSAFVSFSQSDFVLLVYFKQNESSILQIVDFELDSIEGLGESVDIASAEGSAGGDFTLYFVVN